MSNSQNQITDFTGWTIHTGFHAPEACEALYADWSGPLSIGGGTDSPTDPQELADRIAELLQVQYPGADIEVEYDNCVGARGFNLQEHVFGPSDGDHFHREYEIENDILPYQLDRIWAICREEGLCA